MNKSKASQQVRVRKAKINDVEHIHALINQYARRGEMLARSLSDIYENLRDFFVALVADKVIGCAALHINWADLAEVRSLATNQTFKGKKIGTKLLSECIKEARKLGLRRIFALTNRTEFFVKNGFHLVDKNELPQKVWRDCIICPKFPDCDEMAVIRDL